ncbi:MAG: DNRLRE domain-containing protein [Planctomycetota bacterium]
MSRRRPSSSVIATVAAAAVFFVGRDVAAQVTVDLSPARDNTLFEGPQPRSNGAGDVMFVGRNSQGSARRAVLAFDVAAAVPPGATITGVGLAVAITRSNSGDVNVGMHRLLAAWGEGTSASAGGQGAPATTGDATWDHTFFPDQFWALAGGDFVPTASACSTLGEIGPASWSSTTALVADVQQWLDDPSTNHGWLLFGDESASNTAKGLATREFATAAMQPQLTVSYTEPLAMITAVGAGCAATASGQPLNLSSTGLPSLGSGNLKLFLDGGPATPPVLQFFCDLASTPLELGRGCRVYGDPTRCAAGLTLPTRQLAVVIPDVAQLLGMAVTVQGGAVDMTTQTVATSNALVLHLGR